MHRLILAHVPADVAAAQEICASHQGLGAVAVPVREGGSPIHVGPTIQLALVWSATTAAAPEARRLAELAAMSPLSTLVFRVDDTPLSAELEALRLVETQPQATSTEIAATLKMARATAVRRNPALTAAPIATPSPQLGAHQPPAPIGMEGKPGYSRMFMSGMTRGLASSVAVLSLGGGITVGIQERAGLLVSPSFASENTAEARAPLREGVLTSIEVAEQASALRRAAAAQRLEIDTQLAVVSQHLTDVRSSTDETMARLDAISMDADFGVVEVVPGAAPVDAAAPQNVVLAPEPAPAEDTYALTRYVDSVSAEPLADIEPALDDSGLELWSPT